MSLKESKCLLKTEKETQYTVLIRKCKREIEGKKKGGKEEEEKRETGRQTDRQTDRQLVSSCFEPSQPQRITSGLTDNQKDERKTVTWHLTPVNHEGHIRASEAKKTSSIQSPSLIHSLFTTHVAPCVNRIGGK